MAQKPRYVGPLIYQYIQDRGLKQNRIAERAEIPGPIFSAILKGKRDCLAEEYFAICAAMEVPVTKFEQVGV